jgi:predicted nucleotidyltransferase
MNHHTNLVRLKAVATALRELNERVVFVGGATVSLYATDPAASEVRPTDDIDVIIEVATYAEFSSQIEDRLRQLGFTNDVASGIICRYIINGLVVDVMPTESTVLGFSNRWYKEGITQATVYLIGDKQAIRILQAPYFIATKLEAFNSFRHGRDPRLNADFEDIIYVFDNRINLLEEIIQSESVVRSYLKYEIQTLLKNETVSEAINSHLERPTAGQRTQRILNIWNQLANM